MCINSLGFGESEHALRKIEYTVSTFGGRFEEFVDKLR